MCGSRRIQNILRKKKRKSNNEKWLENGDPQPRNSHISHKIFSHPKCSAMYETVVVSRLIFFPYLFVRSSLASRWWWWWYSFHQYVLTFRLAAQIYTKSTHHHHLCNARAEKGHRRPQWSEKNMDKKHIQPKCRVNKCDEKCSQQKEMGIRRGWEANERNAMWSNLFFLLHLRLHRRHNIHNIFEIHLMPIYVHLRAAHVSQFSILQFGRSYFRFSFCFFFFSFLFAAIFRSSIWVFQRNNMVQNVILRQPRTFYFGVAVEEDEFVLAVWSVGLAA